MARSLGSLVLLLQADTKRLERDLNKSNRKLKRFEGTASKAAKKINTALAGIGIGVGVGVGAAFAKIKSDLVNFSSAISDLSAITGATGKDLEFLTDAAREFGATTTLSATEAATALKLIGSAKPDLLKSGEALKAVTKEAIALSEASGVSLSVAAATLGGALNQMAQGADQAGRFINVLAAGSKAGASEVNDTAQALKAAGVAGRLAGLSFEEINAAIQLLSVNSIKGSEAGTALRGIFIKLTTQANSQFNPAVKGMSAALKNLGDANLSANEKLKLFQVEGLNAAEVLIEGADSFGELTKAVTGTSVAYDQQRIRNDNLEGDYKRLTSAVEDLSLEIGESLDASMRESAQLSAEIIRNTSGMIDEFKGLTLEAGFAGEELDGMLQLDFVHWGDTASRAIALVADSLRAIVGIASIAKSSLSVLILKSEELALTFLNKFGSVSDEAFGELMKEQADKAGEAVDDLNNKIKSLLLGPTFAGAAENIISGEGAEDVVKNIAAREASREAERLAARERARQQAASSAGASAAAGKIKTSAGIIQSLRDELALSQAITDEEKFQVELTQGKFRNLVGTDAALGKSLATQIRASDARATALEKTNALEKEREDLAVSVIADLDRQIATHNLLTDAAKIRFELEEGAYKGLEAQSKALILVRTEELEQLQEATIKANELKDAQQAAADKAAQTAREFGNVFTSAFEDAIVSGGKLSDILKGIEQDLIRLILRKAITVPLQNAIGGLFEGSGGFLGDLFGGPRALGGPVQSGKAFLVGEREAELFVPPSSGNIIPVSKLGGGSTVINLNISGVTDADSFNRSRNQILSSLQGGLALARTRAG